jgi:hypothetical protein
MSRPPNQSKAGRLVLSMNSYILTNTPSPEAPSPNPNGQALPDGSKLFYCGPTCG